MKKYVLILILILVLSALVFAVSCSLMEEPAESDKTETDKEERTEKEEDTAEPEYTPEPTSTTKTTSATITVETDFVDSSPLPLGSYVLGYTIGGDEYNEHDINIQIHDGSTGTFYVSDAQNNRYEAKSFTYTFIDNIITFMFDEGGKQIYKFMPTDNDETLFRDESTDVDYHFYRPYDDLFTSIGSWVAVQDDDTLGYICYWADGIGYAKNWEDAQQMVTFDWFYGYGALQVELHNNQGYFEEVFADHYGNVTELTYPRLDYTKVLYRAEGDIMYGSYTLDDTDAEELSLMEISLNENWDAACTVNENGQNVVYDNASWHVNIVDGTLALHIYHEGRSFKMMFDYFYGGDKIILRDTSGYSYSFIKD